MFCNKQNVSGAINHVREIEDGKNKVEFAKSKRYTRTSSLRVHESFENYHIHYRRGGQREDKRKRETECVCVCDTDKKRGLYYILQRKNIYKVKESDGI